MASTGSPPAFRIALLTAVVVAVGWNLALTFLRVEPPWPLTPWESALLGEGWRWTHGLPNYGGERATHLYGPILTCLLGGLEQLWGFNFPAVRVCFALLGVVSCLWLARLVLPTAGLGPWALASGALAGSNLQTGLSFPLSWADMPALLCSVAAWAIFLKPRVGVGGGVLAAVLVVLAVHCKQTFALVPLAFAVLWALDASWRARAGFWLLLPLVATFASLGTLALLAPAVFRQIVIVPSTIQIVPDRVVEGLFYVLRGNPLFWVALAVALWRGRERALWLEWRAWIAVGALLLAGSVWTFGKAGGYYNSLLPVTLFLTCMTVRLLADALVEVEFRVGPGLQGALLLAFLVTTLAGSVESSRLLGLRQGDETRPQWIERLRQLDGKVICPEDTGLIIEANGSSGHSLYFELDVAAVAGNWPEEPPPRIQRELESARWLVTVRAGYPTVLTPDWLQAHGWRALPAPAGTKTVYTLWTRP